MGLLIGSLLVFFVFVLSLNTLSAVTVFTCVRPIPTLWCTKILKKCCIKHHTWVLIKFCKSLQDGASNCSADDAIVTVSH